MTDIDTAALRESWNRALGSRSDESTWAFRHADALLDEVDRLRAMLGEVPPPFVTDPSTYDEAMQKIAGLRGALVQSQREAQEARATVAQAQALRDAGHLVTPEHDREVAARALEEAADSSPIPIDPDDAPWDWLYDRADRVRRGEG